MGGAVAQLEVWWRDGRRGGSMGGVVAQSEAWWLNGKRGGSLEGVVAPRQRARLLSCSPGFESGVSTAHS
jgi:hypothetical protein